MGYGLLDHYDLVPIIKKEVPRRDLVPNQELLNLISQAHSTGGGVPYMDVYADVILNHTYSNNTDAEESGDNPAVKRMYSTRRSREACNVPFPTNEIRWIIPNASAGDYYIQIAGYFLNYGGVVGERGYDVKFTINNALSFRITTLGI